MIHAYQCCIFRFWNKVLFREMSENATMNAIKSFKSKRSFGLDKILSYVFKIATPIVAKSLSIIYNTSILLRIFPKHWKLIRVAPTFKKVVKTDMDNFRPVSVLTLVAGVLERLMYDQLLAYIETPKFLRNYQSGARNFLLRLQPC